MSPDLIAKIRKARFRLGCDLFLRRLVVCLTVAFLAGAAIEFAKRWIAIPVPVEILGLVGLGIGFVAAGVWTFLAAPTRADAAAAIDHHFGLKERITTLLSLPADLQETPAAVALRDDVESRVKDLTIEEKLGIAAPRNGWLPVVPLALLVAAAFFAPEATSPRAEAKAV